MKRTLLSAAALAAGFGLSTPVLAQQPGQPGADLLRIVPQGAQGRAALPTERATLMNQHADPTAAITPADLEAMRLEWSVETEHPVSHTPLISGNKLFTADWGGNVYALDRESGRVLWRNKVENPKMDWPWHGFAGTGTLGGGLLYEASVEGNVFAIDPETGRVVWSWRVAEDPEAGSLARLTYHDGLLFVGLQSVEEPLTKMKQGFKPDFQGKVMALNARTGEKVWERRLVEPPHNGVAVWSSFALDPELGVLYFTTGNNYTGEATPLSDAIVAVNARTGEILWYDQVTQHDVWTMADQKGPDYDFSGGPQIFDAMVNGQLRRMVGAGQKSGIFYAWDRTTGEPVWNTVIGYGGVDGGMHGEASVGSDRIIAWSNNEYIHTMPPGQAPVNIKALDPATGRHLWVKNKAQPAALFAAGYLAGDTYFLPSLDGHVRAYRASDGETIWTSEKIGPITTSVIYADGQVFAVAGKPGIFGDWADGPSGIFAFGPGAATAETD